MYDNADLGVQMEISSEKAYTSQFYEGLRNGALNSAHVIIPMVLKLVPAKQVVDVGCGDGTWLSVFHKLGVRDTIGIDGTHVDRRLLQIPDEQFMAKDLSLPFELSRTFDLALSLEVAEHLPQQAASAFVLSLIKLAPAVLFSAAIPCQDGEKHINEQWPDYWISLFKQHNFLAIDCIRSRIWENELVESWYAQNIFLFVDGAKFENDPLLRIEVDRSKFQKLRIVHPGNYIQAASPSVRRATTILTRSLKRAFWRRVKKPIRADSKV